MDGLRVISLSGKRARTCSLCDVELASIGLLPMACQLLHVFFTRLQIVNSET